MPKNTDTTETLEGGHQTLVRVFPSVEDRVECGSIQFGDDWPGTFIRGDRAGYYALLLDVLLDEVPKTIDALHLRELQGLLSGCVQGPARSFCDPNSREMPQQ